MLLVKSSKASVGLDYIKQLQQAVGRVVRPTNKRREVAVTFLLPRERHHSEWVEEARETLRPDGALSVLHCDEGTKILELEDKDFLCAMATHSKTDKVAAWEVEGVRIDDIKARRARLLKKLRDSGNERA